MYNYINRTLESAAAEIVEQEVAFENIVHENISGTITISWSSHEWLLAAITTNFSELNRTKIIFYNNETNSEQVTLNNYWALLALLLVVCTAAGNILVCLAITWEKRLQNVTNYFLMSLAITDLMVAILVMPLGILTLVKGKYKKTNLDL